MTSHSGLIDRLDSPTVRLLLVGLQLAAVGAPLLGLAPAWATGALLPGLTLAWLWQRQSRRLAELRHGVQSLQAGQWRLDLPELGGGAADGLARALNALAARQQQCLGHLERETGLVSHAIDELRNSRAWLHEGATASVTMVERLREHNARIVDNIGGIYQTFNHSAVQVQEVASASRALSDKISHIAQSTEDASQSVCTITTEAELMSMNIDGINGAMAKVDRAVAEVTGSVAEMNRGMGQVRERCQAARQQSTEATDSARATTGAMQRLADAAREIHHIVEVINDIADQTNMLALNAAIEAAGAGAAGKGFAVVASEVKELARQTADATRSIYDRISAFSQTSDEAGSAVQGIVATVGAINGVIQAIDDSTSQQAMLTQRIEGAMQSVSGAAGEASALARELAGGSGEVFKAANEAADHTKAVALVSAAVATSARHLVESSAAMREGAHAVLDVEQTVQDAAAHIQQELDALYQQMLLARVNAYHVSFAVHEMERLGSALRCAAEAFPHTAPSGDDPLSCDELKIAHLHWLGDLVGHVCGHTRMEEAAVRDPHRCSFGQWLAGLGASEALAPLHALHQRIHAAGGELIALTNQGQLPAALAQLAQLEVYRDELFALTTQMGDDHQVCRN